MSDAAAPSPLPAEPLPPQAEPLPLDPPAASSTAQPPPPAAPRRPSVSFMFRHPAHVIALGFGSGLSPKAPGTAGTLWAWLCFVLMAPHFSPLHWVLTLTLGTLIGWWACTVTARHMAVADPGAIVWDEVLAFWLVLWVALPPPGASSWRSTLLTQAFAFALFRYFDAAKPGPVAWADRLFKTRPGQPIGWAQGFGILFDDFVAAGCTLVVMALWRWVGWP